MDLLQTAMQLRLGTYQWHLLICVDATKPQCCPPEIGLPAWDYLKRRIKELDLDRGAVCVQRTKANCLRVCARGPILLVYPGGYWYHSATEVVIERVLQEHLLGGVPVPEFLFAENPLEPLASSRDL